MVWPTVAALAQLTYGQGVSLVPLTGLPPVDLGLYWSSTNENARIGSSPISPGHTEPNPAAEVDRTPLRRAGSP
jgi:hypothetical protein